MRIDEFEFRDTKGNEIEPTKNQLVIYIKSLHKQIKDLKYENKVLKKALELACGHIGCADVYDFNCHTYKERDERLNCISCNSFGQRANLLNKHFIQQAEKEVKENE